MRRRFTARLTYANVVATIALIVALAAGGPVIAKPIATTAADLAASVRDALRTAKQADRRSKAALALAERKASKGEKGDPGETGETGPATGPAGGALKGVYPNPQLAAGTVGPDQLIAEAVGPSKIEPEAVGADAIEPESITRDHIVDDTLRGTQILESSLVGFDATSFDANASKTVTTGNNFTFLIGNELRLAHKCYGPIPTVGFELLAENESESPRTVFTTTITDGEAPDLGHYEIPPNGKMTIADAPPREPFNVPRWITMLVPGPDYEARMLSAITRVGEIGNQCRVTSFRTTGSG